MKSKVLRALKPKVSAFGFSKEEVESAAATIANNLHLEEGASEEEVTNAINEAVDNAIPFLKVGQQAASRQVEAFRKSHQIDDDPNTDDDTDDGASKGPKKKGQEDEPAWAKALREQIAAQGQELASLRAEKTSTSRRERLSNVVKNTGTYGERVLKSFSRMQFESDEAFDEYLTEVQEDLKSYNQERANDGLSRLGNPPAATDEGKKKKEELSEDELKGLADLYK